MFICTKLPFISMLICSSTILLQHIIPSYVSYTRAIWSLHLAFYSKAFFFLKALTTEKAQLKKIRASNGGLHLRVFNPSQLRFYFSLNHCRSISAVDKIKVKNDSENLLFRLLKA